MKFKLIKLGWNNNEKKYLAQSYVNVDNDDDDGEQFIIHRF